MDILSPVRNSIDALDEFDSCGTAEELWEKFLSALEPLGLQSTMYIQGVTFDDMNETCLEAQSHCDTLLGSLISDDFVTCVKSDPTLRKIDYYSQYWKRTIRPLAFGCTTDASCPQAARPLNRLMHEYGVVGGLIVPLRGYGSKQFGNVSFMLSPSSAVGLSDLPIGALTAIAHHLNAHMTAALRKKCEAVEELSRRERECLKWIAAGLSTKQLSDRMGITADTANEYIGNARRKMKARSRSEAVARALSLKMISL